MVEKRLELEPEVQDIFSAIDNGKNFLLSGGAGSGKTFSLVQVIRQVIAENPTVKIACMTYTFAAVREIDERINHKNLKVSTFHEFLWANIKHFQKELKSILVNLANDDTEKRIRISNDAIPNDYFNRFSDGIQYKEYLKLSEGIISHDELLIVANVIFRDYPLLCDIVKDKFKFIFIDEYQDTNRLVVDIFLKHFKNTNKKNIIGFFGDAMQSIYDDGIGSLDEFLEANGGEVVEIKKKQNRRNPKKIMDLANLLRTDGITQEPSNDITAPNMNNGKIKDGNIKFIHSTNYDITNVENYLSNNFGWDFTDSRETKELNLTHNLIADKAGFRSLMDIYDKDKIIAYKNRIRKYIKDKAVKEDFSTFTFGQVIDFLKKGKEGKELNAVMPTRGMQEFISLNESLFKTALDSNYALFSKIYVNSEQLIDDKKQTADEMSKRGSKRDYLIQHLFKIQHNINLYQNKRYNEFLRVTDFRDKICSIESKKVLDNNIKELVEVGNKTISDIIIEADEKGICIIDEKLERFKLEKEYVYNRVIGVKFSEFQKLYSYLEGYTPFSTKHKTKGSEFNNILVILDNGGWNKYNFRNLFLNEGSQSVLARSQKIFYVCCTRAKENLAIFYHNPSPDVVDKAEEWFGNTNVISL
jgi:DNA helicase-2/ATP-dependent DNA helicase PcrA